MCVSGPPYDTLEEVIGTRGAAGQGSLAEFNVSFRCLDFPFTQSGKLDVVALEQGLREGKHQQMLQRSQSTIADASIEEIMQGGRKCVTFKDLVATACGPH